MEEKIWIIAYDVCNAKRLRKMEKLCEDYTKRIQYSVYQLTGRETVMDNFIKRMEKIINPKEDSVIIFGMNKTDMDKTRRFGIAKESDDDDKKYFVYK
jgi:CRISPR-associated protein Cas2